MPAAGDSSTIGAGERRRAAPDPHSVGYTDESYLVTTNSSHVSGMTILFRPPPVPLK